MSLVFRGTPMTNPERIRIFDTTLRDGEQSPGCSMNLEEKIRLARQLERLGVDVIEAGFPIASEGDFAAVRAVAAECREVCVAALCRTTEADILRAWEAVGGAARPRLHTFVATSDIHLRHKLKKTRAEVLRMTREAVGLARSLTEDVEFSAEDATRSDVDYLCEVFAAATENAPMKPLIIACSRMSPPEVSDEPAFDSPSWLPMIASVVRVTKLRAPDRPTPT